MRPIVRFVTVLGQGRGAGVASLLPFSDDFNRADGAIGNGWEGSGSTWTISGNKAINTPTLGSELIVNGDFASDTVWTKGTGWTIAAGVASKAAGAAANITQSVLTIGAWYRTVQTLVNRTGGNFAVIFGSSGTLGPTLAADGTYTATGRAATTTLAGMRAVNSTSAADLDNVSYKQLTLAELFRTRDFGRADVDVSVKVTVVSGNRAGLVLNLDSASSPANFVTASHDGVNARLSKAVAGVYTELISAAATYSAGAALRVVKSGPTTYQFWYNGVQIGTDQTVSDAGIINNTRHGMFNTYELNGLDDFSILAV